MTIARIQIRDLKCQRCGRDFRDIDIDDAGTTVTLTCGACHCRPLELELVQSRREQAGPSHED